MIKSADRTTALIILTIASFLTPFTASAVNIALPSIAAEFNLDAVTLGWVSTAYLLATAIVLVPAGRWADIHGRKLVFLAGAVVFGLTSFLIALAPTAAILIALRVLQGAGGAMISATAVAILIAVYPPQEKGRVLGINTAAVYVGLSLGPTIGGILTQQFGWHSVFLVMVPLAILVIFLTLWKLPGEWAEARGDTFDLLGSILYGLSLLAIMYGFTVLPDGLGAALITFGVVGFVAFAGWEGRVKSPVLDLRIFRNNTVFTYSNMAALINYSATSASGFLLSLYLQQIRGLQPETAGLLLIAQPVVQAIFSPTAGHMSDSVEPRLLASAGMAMTAAGLFLFALLSPTTPLILVVLVLMLLGLGFGLFSSPNTNAVMSSVDRKRYGIASATLSTMRTVGQTMSIGIAVLIFALIIGHVAISPTVYPQLMSSIKITFLIFGVLCLVGIYFSLSRGKLHE